VKRDRQLHRYQLHHRHRFQCRPRRRGSRRSKAFARRNVHAVTVGSTVGASGSHTLRGACTFRLRRQQKRPRCARSLSFRRAQLARKSAPRSPQSPRAARLISPANRPGCDPLLTSCGCVHTDRVAKHAARLAETAVRDARSLLSSILCRSRRFHYIILQCAREHQLAAPASRSQSSYLSPVLMRRLWHLSQSLHPRRRLSRLRPTGCRW
jgi:hypothetical protein